MKRTKSVLYNLIRKTEKYTKTDMLYVTRGSFWLGSGYIFATASGLMLTAALANWISPEVYGTYKYILAIAAIVGALTLTGLSTSIVRSVANGYEGTFTTGFWTILRWNITVTIVSASIALYYYIQGNNDLALSMLIVGCFSPFVSSGILSQSFLVGKELFRAQTIQATAKSLITSSTLILVVFFVDELVLILLAYFGMKAFVEIGFYIFTVLKYRPNKKVDTESIAFSKHLSFMNVLLIIARQSDKLIMFQFLGPAQLALYSLAIAPVSELKTPEKFLGKLALPKLSKLSIPEIKKTLPRKMYFVFGLSAFLTVTYILLAPYLFKYVFPQYIDAVLYSQVFSLVLLLTPSLFFNQVFVAHMQTSQLYKIRMSLPVFKIVLLFILVPLYGIWGAIATLLLNHLASFILHLFYFYRL